MSEAVRFLHALAHALSTMSLYTPGHPATKRALEQLWQSLIALLQVDNHPVFLFLGSGPIYSGRALHELRDWYYGRRLADAGVQRLEFDPTVMIESLSALLDRLMLRLSSDAPAGSDEEPALKGILFGTVAVLQPAITIDHTVQQDFDVGGREFQLDLADELEAMSYIREAAGRGVVARAEAEAVVRILGRLLDHHELPQAAHGTDPLRYHSEHPVNTALLAMAAATVSGVDRVGRHRVGVMALFHDIGMARLPAELGNKESLTDEERALVETHTMEGARLLLGAGSRGLELAAVVAWEHHLRPDGTGYPNRRFRPPIHWASRLIGVAASYTALRAPRPYRSAWSVERAVRHLEDGAGTVFDAEAAKLLAGVVRPT